jgi:hypothetical protein
MIFIVIQRWQSCCFSAHDCCERQLASPLGDLNKTCGRTWDGWGCWDDTKPGQQAPGTREQTIDLWTV